MSFTIIAMRLALAVPVVRMLSLATESINDFKHDYSHDKSFSLTEFKSEKIIALILGRGSQCFERAYIS